MGTFIRNVNSYRFLAVRDASRSSGVGLIQWSLSRDGSQEWGLQQVSPGVFKIRNMLSGKVVDVPHSTNQQGAQLIQYDENGGNNQLWVLGRVTVPDGIDGPIHFFKNVATNQIMDVEGASRNDGDHIVQWPQSGGIRGNQQWMLTDKPVIV